MLSSDLHMPTQNNKVRLRKKAMFSVAVSQCAVFVTGAGLTRMPEGREIPSPSQKEHCPKVRRADSGKSDGSHDSCQSALISMSALTAVVSQRSRLPQLLIPEVTGRAEMERGLSTDSTLPCGCPSVSESEGICRAEKMSSGYNDGCERSQGGVQDGC